MEACTLGGERGIGNGDTRKQEAKRRRYFIVESGSSALLCCFGNLEFMFLFFFLMSKCENEK